jgi:anti-anti-sigma factor
MHETADGVVVVLRGEAGVAEAGALERLLLSLVARRPSSVIFDLSELLFISSLAMGVLVAFRRAVVRGGGRVYLEPELHPALREALDRAELLSLFDTARRAEPDVAPGPCPEGAAALSPSVADMPRRCAIAWWQLVELEPRLEELLRRARTAGVHCTAVADVPGLFSPLRNELAELIGFAGKHQFHPILGTTAAYQVAYWKLYDAVAGLLPRRAGSAAVAPDKDSKTVVETCLTGPAAAPGDGEFIDGLGI